MNAPQGRHWPQTSQKAQPGSQTKAKGTRYVAHEPDARGRIHYSDQENATWKTLMTRQMALVEGRVCREYRQGLERLALPEDRIPQLGEIDRVLEAATGWRTARVPALIPFTRFFELLAERRFPVATFIRSPEELDYLQEPDIFHEIFGHCPMLTHPAFAEFTATYGRLGLAASKEERVYLARLYWMTVEFGMLRETQPDGSRALRLYGGGIISSPRETRYALGELADSLERPAHLPFDAVEALRTPYRIDILQPLYYVLESLDDLHELASRDIMALVHEAMTLGLKTPRFAPR
ncbi:MAG: phenylalanine 4-monooxygenase [Cobetia sp.]|uniref:phenylalanine 4-monooxygenase n=1 Tax=Cobetia sp. TaxID=1873876 RepID=UPI000C558733|nr:phenylalanine 4-monooxygenase [Cobetia sp.]MBF09111.1 phenylalanine 4-monooxygenase [Cobetia sp.]MBK09477.1 phenylalanine 4-monooxygenase [Cobetia sp.]HBJ27177.1 phenylalanine 4-monooxygenase [Cobetia sp.]|tara:strand:+ start:23081 stop:23962 length:882 start_codon:yes stop_codon:yes gene_type:complete